MSNKFQRFTDLFWQKTLLPFLPVWVSPNHITIIRLIMIPLVIYLLAIKLFGWSFLLFILAVLLDTVDGALARVRKQTSDWGLILDPGADKFLVILTVLFLSLYYPVPLLPILMILADLMLLLAGALVMIIFKVKTPLAANWLGKLKMVAATLAILLIYLALIFPLSQAIFIASVVAMVVAMILGFLSFLVYGLKFLY